MESKWNSEGQSVCLSIFSKKKVTQDIYTSVFGNLLNLKGDNEFVFASVNVSKPGHGVP